MDLFDFDFIWIINILRAKYAMRWRVGDERSKEEDYNIDIHQLLYKFTVNSLYVIRLMILPFIGLLWSPKIKSQIRHYYILCAILVIVVNDTCFFGCCGQ